MKDYLERPAGEMPAGWADAYDETSFWAARFGALLFDCLDLRPVHDGLDVGCGTGFPLIELAQVHGASSRWVGVDVWRDGLARAEKKISVLGLRNVELREANAASLPFDGEAFELITSNLGINNFDDPAAAVSECARVARHGARIAITTNVNGHMSAMYDILRDVAPHRRAGIDAQEAHRGTLQSVSRLLNDAGFKVSRHVLREFGLTFADGSAMLRHSLVKWFLDGWRGVLGDDDALWSEIERRLNARAPLRFNVPMLYIEGVRG